MCDIGISVISHVLNLTTFQPSASHLSCVAKTLTLDITCKLFNLVYMCTRLCVYHVCACVCVCCTDSCSLVQIVILVDGYFRNMQEKGQVEQKGNGNKEMDRKEELRVEFW